MTDRLHRIAENDTPAAVDVPETIQGLMLWAIGRTHPLTTMIGAGLNLSSTQLDRAFRDASLL